MPHCLIEYSDNVAEEIDSRGLVAKIAGKYAQSDGVFPVIGIRVRAIAVRDYFIADGKPENAFVHATCTVSPGRSEALLRRFFGEMFEIMKQHLAGIATGRFLGLSLDVVVAGDVPSFKHNWGWTAAPV